VSINYHHVYVFGGAAVGTVAGMAIGGPVGAAVGAGLGAMVGMGAAAMSGGKHTVEVEITVAGTLRFKVKPT
jgi:outer membrane lipoprotein SlyB